MYLYLYRDIYMKSNICCNNTFCLTLYFSLHVIRAPSPILSILCLLLVVVSLYMLAQKGCYDNIILNLQVMVFFELSFNIQGEMYKYRVHEYPTYIYYTIHVAYLNLFLILCQHISYFSFFYYYYFTYIYFLMLHNSPHVCFVCFTECEVIYFFGIQADVTAIFFFLPVYSSVAQLYMKMENVIAFMAQF